jgi:hypothetical protein
MSGKQESAEGTRHLEAFGQRAEVPGCKPGYRRGMTNDRSTHGAEHSAAYQPGSTRGIGQVPHPHPQFHRRRDPCRPLDRELPGDPRIRGGAAGSGAGMVPDSGGPEGIGPRTEPHVQRPSGHQPLSRWLDARPFRAMGRGQQALRGGQPQHEKRRRLNASCR